MLCVGFPANSLLKLLEESSFPLCTLPALRLAFSLDATLELNALSLRPETLGLNRHLGLLRNLLLLSCDDAVARLI